METHLWLFFITSLNQFLVSTSHSQKFTCIFKRWQIQTSAVHDTPLITAQRHSVPAMLIFTDVLGW
jgi:hypothetical protein